MMFDFNSTNEAILFSIMTMTEEMIPEMESKMKKLRKEIKILKQKKDYRALDLSFKHQFIREALESYRGNLNVRKK